MKEKTLAYKIEELKKMLPDGNPVGITFKTQNGYYYYDTVTGKVLACQKVEYEIIEKILAGELEKVLYTNEYSEGVYVEALEHIMAAIQNEKILALSKFSLMAPFNNYEELVNHHLEQITLELTEKCNLRCGYCIYNEMCEKSRDFGERDMTLEIALKAIDYAKSHSTKTKELYVGYYGGEPLINYDTMIRSMRYAMEKITDRKVYFSFTTNAVLLNKKMCQELSEIPNLSVTVSLDGPKQWHDLYRKNQGGEGSFDRTLEGVKNLVEAYGHERAKDYILFSMVYALPYSMERLQETQEFFESLSWLPEECVKLITYPDEESMDTIYKYLQKENLSHKLDKINTEYDFSLVEFNQANLEKQNRFTKRLVEDSYLHIRKRTVFDAVMDSITMNGCCVPGQRKLYVTVDGQFKICERVGEIPNIGSLEKGIDIEKAKRIYIDDYAKQSMKTCATCWYARLCKICYCGCYTKDKLDMEKKTIMCEECKKSCLRSLAAYFEILEKDEHALDHLDDMSIN